MCLSALSQRCHQSAIIIELLSPKTRVSCHGRVLTVFRHLKENLNLFLAWETATITFKGHEVFEAGIQQNRPGFEVHF